MILHLHVIILDLALIFQENPFRDRVYEVFSSDRTGNLNFDEFLDLHSVFSSRVSLLILLVSVPLDTQKHENFCV